MDTALITGMFETSFLPDKQVEMDVKNGNSESFSKILESSLKNNEVSKIKIEDGNKNKEVEDNSLDIQKSDNLVDVEEIEVEEETKDSENTEDVDNIVDEVLDDIMKNEGKPKKKDKKNKESESLKDFVVENDLTKLIKKDNVIQEDVEKLIKEVNIEDVSSKDEDVIKLLVNIKNKDNEKLEKTPEEKLNSLLNKLDVKLTENAKIKDDSEQVIKVGPQRVETEKIELNITDVEKNIEVNKDHELENKIVSRENNVNNPTIQNPFKLKRLSEETDKLSQEENSGNGEVKNNDVDEFLLKLEQIQKEFSGESYFSKKDLTKEKLSSEENVDEFFPEQIKIEKKIRDVKNIEDNTLEENNEILKYELKETNVNQEGFNNKESEKDGSNKKEDNLKIRDFRNKKDVKFEQEIFNKEDVKVESKFEIKEVGNIRKFENFVEQDILDQVTEKLEVSLFDNKSEMVIKLKPNDLGKVTVKISIENGVMNAKFLADSIKVKETLESSLNNLKETLKDQGINVQNLSVSVDTGRSQNNQTFEQNRLVYFNNKKDYQAEKTVSYEDTYYEFSNINTNNVRNYWMDSTVSFLA